MSKSRGSARRSRRMAVVICLAAICGAAVLGSSGTASAGNLTVCGGSVHPANPKKAGDDAVYQIQCSDDLRGFSLISTEKLDFFGSETDVVPTTTQSAQLQCEGTIPGDGFGCGIVNRNTPTNCGASPTAAKCTQRVSAGNILSGDISFVTSPCVAKPKVWVSATNEPFVESFSPTAPGGSTFTTGEYASQPWQLKVKGFKGKACKAAIKADKKQSEKTKK